MKIPRLEGLNHLFHLTYVKLVVVLSGHFNVPNYAQYTETGRVPSQSLRHLHDGIVA